MTKRRRQLSIIGAGSVGTALACLAHRAGYDVVAVASRRMESSRRACRMLGRDVAVAEATEAAERGDLVLITTPDDAIAEVCRTLADAGAFRPDSVVAHCSGALSSNVLAPAREQCGVHVGSVHPMQTFPNAASALSRFAGTWCFVEGDPPAISELRDLFTAIGGRVEQISTAKKALYHAAAVVACNYLVALLEAAGELAEHAGIDRARANAAMQPLVEATVENARRLGPAQALTGPVARGDVETVRQHLAAIEPVSSELAALYRLMGRRAVAIARGKGTLDAAAAGRLSRILD